MSSIVIAGNTSGSVTLQAPAIANATVLTLPNVSGSLVGTDAGGNISVTGNITAFSTSDKIFKENIQNISNALDIVSTIGGKTFDWSDAYIAEKGGVDGYFLNKTDFGVVAQDVQAVFPLAVRTKADGTLVVDYIKLCALAFAAIRELKIEVDSLRKEI